MVEETSPRTSPQVKSNGTMTFTSCLNKLMLGERCRRLAWEDDGIYVVIQDEKLKIFNTDDKILHPLIISAGDISGTDWIIVGKQEDLS